MTNKFNFFKVYDNTLNDIKKYNRADTVNMNESEMNKFRHIAAPAYLTSDYYNPLLVRFFGYGKELKDLFQGRTLEDTKNDLRNNEIGLDIGWENRKQKRNQKNLFDYIFETQINPNRGQK